MSGQPKLTQEQRDRKVAALKQPPAVLSGQSGAGTGRLLPAQRYPAGIAHERMAKGLCPECGEPADEHTARRGEPLLATIHRASLGKCDLYTEGVTERIVQYRVGSEETTRG